jgi:hypothetical protein
MTSTETDTLRIAFQRRTQPLALLVALLAIALSACSKCDVPNLLPHQAGPQTCHDGPPPS